MITAIQTIQMPISWFPHLVSDICIHMTPYEHFGSGWGNVLNDGHSIELHVSTTGQWNVLITGIRKDMCGIECGTMPTEYMDDLPTNDV